MGAGTGKATPVGPIRSADSLPLHVVSQTSKLIVLGWTPPSGIIGYVFSVDGKRVSSTFDASRSTVQFSYRKGSVYRVTAIVEGVSGAYVG